MLSRESLAKCILVVPRLFGLGSALKSGQTRALFNTQKKDCRMLSKHVSFIVDQKGNRRAAVVPIDIFDELMALQKALATSTPGQRERYFFSVKGAEASG